MRYITGDLFDHPVFQENYNGSEIFLVHVNNNQGKWGAGFVVPLGNKYPLVKQRYLSWHERGVYWHANFATFYGNEGHTNFKLGEIQPVKIHHLVVVNMIAQEGFGETMTLDLNDGHFKLNLAPIRYGALSKCLSQVGELARKRGSKVIMPAIGSGLAGGHWPTIESIIIETLFNVNVTICQLEGQEVR